MIHFMDKKSKKEMTGAELKWQAQEDARTIERYQEILNDKARLDRALKAATETIDNLEERAKALSKSITGLKKK